MHWSYCNIKDFSRDALEQAYIQLSDSRKEHIDRLRRSEDKIRSLAAELLLQKLLERFGVTGAILHRDPTGKPYLSGCDLYVSISHCDQIVACAVSEEPVGIDVEQIRPVDLNICRHICTDEEKSYIGTDGTEGQLCQDPDILLRFFTVWTAKEAYFKKRGTGITNPKSVNTLKQPRQMQMLGGYLLQII